MRFYDNVQPEKLTHMRLGSVPYLPPVGQTNGPKNGLFSGIFDAFEKLGMLGCYIPPYEAWEGQSPTSQTASQEGQKSTPGELNCRHLSNGRRGGASGLGALG